MANRFYIPADTGGDPALALLQSVARRIRTAMAKHLLDTGLYPGQETVIEIVAAEGQITPGEIAKRLSVRPPTITKTLTRLQEQGFIDRSGSANDARLVHVSLTEAGEAILATMLKARKKAEKQALKGVKKKERKQLVKCLEKIDANLGEQ